MLCPLKYDEYSAQTATQNLHTTSETSNLLGTSEKYKSVTFVKKEMIKEYLSDLLSQFKDIRVKKTLSNWQIKFC